MTSHADLTHGDDFLNRLAMIATRMAAKTICVMNVSQKPQPAACPTNIPPAPPKIPRKIVMRQPIGCMDGTRMRAIPPITIPTNKPLRRLLISMALANHFGA